MKKINQIVLILTFSFLFTCYLQSQTGWYLVESGQTNWQLNSVCFANSNFGFAVGANGTLSKTTNSGVNWFLQYTGTNNSFGSVYFPSQNVGYIVSNGGVLGKTINGGINWNLYPIINNIQTSVFFINESTGYIACGGGIFLKTNDGGANWISNFVHNASIFSRSVYFVNINTGYVAGYLDSLSTSSGVIYKTTNAGNNWQLINQNSVNSSYASIFFNDLLTGYCVGYFSNSSGIILKTTDSGNSWFVQSQPSYNLMSVYFIDNYTGFAVGGTGSITKTTNSGNNWIIQQNLATSYTLNSVWFINSLTGFAVGSYGTIIMTTNGGEPFGIKPLSNEVPKSFSLYQNYPNPFNTATKIKFSIPDVRSQMSEVRLEIYDILGYKVATLVNQKLSPGMYEVEWNASNYSSGVYFYKLIATDPETPARQSGGSSGLYFTQTRKLILLK